MPADLQGRLSPCPVHSCRGSTTTGCGSLKTKEDDSAVTGFRVSITIQQRRVGLWAWLGTGNKVPCMQQVPAIATQGKKRVGSSKCNPSRVFKKIKNLQQNPQRSRSVPDSDSRLARHDWAPGGWIGWGFAAVCRSFCLRQFSCADGWVPRNESIPGISFWAGLGGVGLQ